MGKEDRRDGRGLRIGLAGGQRVEQGGVEDERFAELAKVTREAGHGGISGQAGTGDDGVGVAREVEQGGNRAARKAAIAGGRESDHHCFGHGDTERDGDDVGDGQLELAGTGAHCAVGGEQSGAGHVARSGNDQNLAVAVLVAAFDARERVALQGGGGERGGALHRDPVIMSRSAVFGVPSSSIGAPWFHKARVGTHNALASRRKS